MKTFKALHAPVETDEYSSWNVMFLRSLRILSKHCV